ncbi:MAG: hypothetical protein AAB467_04160 [Patescibacteria group bacterium]
MRKEIIFAIAGTLLLAGFGCGQKAAQTALETATGGQVKIDDEGKNMEVRTKDGSVNIGEQSSLPESWPSDAPAYPGASVTFSSVTNPVDGKGGISVMLQTAEAGAIVADYYKRELVAQGWVIEATNQFDQTVSLNASKAGRTLGLTVASDETGTSIVETVSTN